MAKSRVGTKSNDSTTVASASDEVRVGRYAPGPDEIHSLIIQVMDAGRIPMTEFDIVRALVAINADAETIPIQFRIARMVSSGELLRYYESEAAKPLYVRTGQE